MQTMYRMASSMQKIGRIDDSVSAISNVTSAIIQNSLIETRKRQNILINSILYYYVYILRHNVEFVNTIA